jgi:hypothetical protein
MTPPPLKMIEARALIDAPWISAVADEVRDINAEEPRAISTVLTIIPEAAIAGMMPVPAADVVWAATPEADNPGMVADSNAGTPTAAAADTLIWIVAAPDRLLTWPSCADAERIIRALPDAARTNEAAPNADRDIAVERAIEVPEVRASPVALIPTEAPPDALSKPWAAPEADSDGTVATAEAASTWPSCALDARRSSEASPTAPLRCAAVAVTLIAGIAAVADAKSNCCPWAAAASTTVSAPDQNIWSRAWAAHESVGIAANPEPDVADEMFGTITSAASKSPEPSAARNNGVTASASSSVGIGFWTDRTSTVASPAARSSTIVVADADSERIVIAVDADDPIAPPAATSMLALPEASARWPNRADAASGNIVDVAELFVELVSGAITSAQSIFANPMNCNTGVATATHDNVIRFAAAVPCWAANPTAPKVKNVGLAVALETEAWPTADIEIETKADAGWVNCAVPIGLRLVTNVITFTVTAWEIGPNAEEKALLHGELLLLEPFACVAMLWDTKNTIRAAPDDLLFCAEIIVGDMVIVLRHAVAFDGVPVANAEEKALENAAPPNTPDEEVALRVAREAKPEVAMI